MRCVIRKLTSSSTVVPADVSGVALTKCLESAPYLDELSYSMAIFSLETLGECCGLCRNCMCGRKHWKQRRVLSQHLLVNLEASTKSSYNVVGRLQLFSGSLTRRGQRYSRQNALAVADVLVNTAKSPTPMEHVGSLLWQWCN